MNFVLMNNECQTEAEIKVMLQNLKVQAYLFIIILTDIINNIKAISVIQVGALVKFSTFMSS